MSRDAWFPSLLSCQVGSSRVDEVSSTRLIARSRYWRANTSRGRQKAPMLQAHPVRTYFDARAAHQRLWPGTRLGEWFAIRARGGAAGRGGLGDGPSVDVGLRDLAWGKPAQTCGGSTARGEGQANAREVAALRAFGVRDECNIFTAQETGSAAEPGSLLCPPHLVSTRTRRKTRTE